MVSDVLKPIGVDDVTWLESKEEIHLVKPTNYLAPQVKRNIYGLIMIKQHK